MQLTCPSCDRRGCSECGGIGSFVLPECPQRYVDQELWDAIDMVSFAENGHLPIAGGVLDQTKFFTDVHKFVSNERATMDIAKIKDA
jgi:hypothetical protein